MTAKEPIDLDCFKIEEDLYGDKIISKQESPEFDTPEPEFSFKGKKLKGKSPYSKPSNRRHPEDAETEDKVLVALVDGGMPWR